MSLAPEASAQGNGKDKGKKEHHHHSGKDKLGDKVKQNGKHVIDTHGDHTMSVDVKDGKVAGMRVKHAKKGDVAVKMYKTNKKVDSSGTIQLVAYNAMLAQAYSLGTTWIGYAYIDDYGYEQIYWYPYEMIDDGDTGAMDYVPLICAVCGERSVSIGAIALQVAPSGSSRRADESAGARHLQGARPVLRPRNTTDAQRSPK